LLSDVKLCLVIAMDKPRQRRSAGPRSFDRDQAIETAMRLFWQHGYEGVSVADLTGAIGIAPPSLYAAFGSKAGLYREALDLYAGLPGALDGMQGAKTLEQAITGLLDAAIKAVTAENRGCMISTGLVEGATEQQELARELGDRRLAAYLSAVQQGMSVQARDGATSKELSRIADETVAGILARRATHVP
jgi:AcrR family transcriptional regulator